MSQININNEPSAEVIIDENGTPVTVIIATSGASGAVWGSITGTLSDQTDLQNALDAKVPYSGATGNVNLGEYGISTGYVQLDTTPTTYTPAVGNLGYNDTVGTLETTLKGGTVQLKIGRDMFERVVNKTGVQLTKAAYQAVRVSDAQGQRLAVALAQANNDNNSADTIGLVIETIDVNQEGNIFTVGEITGINTTGSLQGETWADGDVLYLSPTVAGRITNVKPVAPQHLVIIGYVVYAHQNNGKIYTKIMNGWELGELHDVNTTGATAGQVLKYNGTIWAPSADAGVTGSGNTDYVAKFTGTGTIGNSVIRVSGTDATYFSTNKAASSDGNNIFIGGGGQFLTSVPGSPTLASYNVALGINALLANTEGNESIAIGYNALTSNTVGTQNSALGYQSLASNIGGFRNTSVGYFSLFSNSSGYENTSVGANALFSSNSSGNSAFGVYSLFLNTDGFDNTGLGKYALYTNSTGDENSAVGSFSLRFNTLGNRNTGLGFESLRSNTTANDNVGIGYRAGLTNTTGSNNIFLGSNSGGVSITESNRTWIGNSSTTSTWLGGNLLLGSTTDAGQRLQVTGLSSFTGTTASDGGQLGSELLSSANWTLGAGWTGTYATGFAHSSGTATLTNTLAAVNGTYYQIAYTVTNRTAGSFTIAFGGYTSGNLSATGSVGPRATSTASVVITPTTDFNGTIVISIKAITASSASIQLRNSSGTITNEIRNDVSNTNTFIGLNAGSRNLGTLNTFIGTNSAQNNTSGSQNVFIGNSSGQNNTIGSGNSFFGQNVGVNNVTGSTNSFFGLNSGQANTSGSNNNFYGVNSGFSNTTGIENNFIGILSGGANTSGSYNSFFGNNSGRFNISGSSILALGYEAGRRISGGGNLTVANNSTFLGVDTRANADSETNQLVVGYSAIGLGSNTTVIGNSSTTFGRWWGNLLVGTSTNSGFALDVTGTGRVQSSPSINSDATLTINSTTNNSTASATLYGINHSSTISTINSTSAFIGLNSSNNASSNVSSVISYNGNVNVSAGTTTTARVYHSNSAVTSTGTITNHIGYDYSDVFKGGSGSLGRQFAFRIANLVNGTTANVGLLFNDSSSTAVNGNWDIYAQSGKSSYFAGDFYLGTTSTSATKLTVGGSETASSAIARGQLVNTTLVASANNDVLVGLDINPTFTNGAFTGVSNLGLRVQGTARVTTLNLFHATGTQNILFDGSSVNVSHHINATFGVWVRNQNTSTGIDATVEGASQFGLGLYATGSERVRIRNNGNVLINTTTDAGFKLDVNGTARIQNDLTISDTRNIILATGTGTKIGTATSQKLAFWNATPIVQPTTGIAEATFVENSGGTAVNVDSTFAGYTLQQIAQALKNIGILA